MAHNLNFKNNRASFFTAKEVAWHGLGQLVQDAQTSAEAIKLAQLDFEVKKAPLYADVKESVGGIELPNLIEVPNKFHTYRNDTKDIFGIISNRYEIIQNQEAFDFFDTIVGENKAIFETAGCLNKGETVFITAKLPAEYIVGRNDLIENYLLLSTTHDGTGCITVMFTPIRVVCNNTLSMALSSNKNKVSIKHTKDAKYKLLKASELLGITSKNIELEIEYYNYLAEKKISDAQLLHYIKDVFDMKPDKETGKLSTRSLNTLEEILQYNAIGVGQNVDECKGTAWGAYNAITGYLHNVKKYKTSEDEFQAVLSEGKHHLQAIQRIGNYL